ncbi:16S rRNA (guanine(966)-N(2))-methyltransferase RsmD [Clostridium cylindrosporum]|uniref:16S rRNA (Guanine(966)-N(2))-methyltransferase RsmD n=1 Tax=Clostridium cylindrosporum DSM 605 TaxID=1121307 RepID=A0A0J8DAZ5_CLOCY|nr:16S rRNA (guanine(966)-N(2))-methyltransferase RsmD [Clostridium cylindrosporum]KMT21468.1 16S rRNA (guanine(966)-N(2))-methyltransferase RsmD [Clostridium cylindrosporum DSM 605]
MRIISGSAKGRKIKTPDGLDTRPTSDRVKESVFNIILRYVFDANVLDLFGGTGNLGLEALSRGANQCIFVEQNKKAYNTLRENISDLGFGEKAVTYNKDSFSILNQLAIEGKSFNLIFLDPPYGKGYVEKSIEEIDKLNLLEEDGLIVSEYDNVDNVSEKIGNFEVYRTEKYGRVRISFWRKEIGNE